MLVVYSGIQHGYDHSLSPGRGHIFSTAIKATPGGVQGSLLRVRSKTAITGEVIIRIPISPLLALY
jgi:hypothetical protein